LIAHSIYETVIPEERENVGLKFNFNKQVVNHYRSLRIPESRLNKHAITLKCFHGLLTGNLFEIAVWDLHYWPNYLRQDTNRDDRVCRCGVDCLVGNAQSMYETVIPEEREGIVD